MRYIVANAGFWIAAVLLMLGSSQASAEGRFYIGIGAGFSKSGDLDVSHSFAHRPTRCDPFLYSAPETPPDDAECSGDIVSSVKNTFAPATDFAGGASLGYAFGNGLRLEAEYLNRHYGTDERLVRLGSASDDPLDQKRSEWSAEDPPSEQIYDFSAHDFFLNAYYDLRTGSPFTPYVGAGIGLGSVNVRYWNQFVRATDLGPQQWQKAAAGTTSYIDAELEKTGFGFQVMGGVDYSLGESVSIGAKARWARLSGFDQDGEAWGSVRGRSPVRADGVTPFTSDFKVGDMDSWAFTVGIKHYL